MLTCRLHSGIILGVKNVAAALSAAPFAVASLHYPAADSCESSRHTNVKRRNPSGFPPDGFKEAQPKAGIPCALN